MKINQLKAGVIFSYLAQAVSILTGILYTPIMLRLLGQSEYGLYQLVYSVVSYLGLLSFGFGAGYVRFYSRYKAEKEEDGIARLNGMYLTIFSVITIVCLFCGALLIFNAGAVFGKGLTAVELEKAKVLLGLMTINVALAFINSVFASNIIVHEKFLFERGTNFVHLLLSPFVTLPLLLAGCGSVAVVGVTAAFTLGILVLNIFYCFKNLRMKISFKGFDKGILKEIWIFTFFIFVIMMVDRINLGMGKFLLGRIEGTAAVAIFSVASQINILYANFSTAVSQMFIPRINRIVAEDNSNRGLSVLFARVGRIQFLVLALVLSGFVIYGREFIGFWAGDGYSESYVVGVILLGAATVPLIQNLGIEIQKAKNLHRVAALVSLGAAAISVFVSIPLIERYSFVGAAAGYAVSLVMGNVLFMNWYYQKRVGLDMKYFWREIAKLVFPLAVTVVCGLTVRQIIPPGGSILRLGADIIIYCVIYAAVFWYFGMNDAEKNIVRVPIYAVFNKLKGIFAK